MGALDKKTDGAGAIFVSGGHLNLTPLAAFYVLAERSEGQTRAALDKKT